MNTKTKETPHVKINNHHQIYNDTCSINTDCDTSFESPGDYHFCTNCTCNTQMTSVVQVSTELQHFHQKNNTSSRRDSLTDFKKSIIQSIRNSFSSKTNASTNAPLSKKHTAVSPDIKNSTLKEAAVTHSTENSENEEPLKKETLNPILPRRQQSTVELPVYDQTLSICRNSSQEIVVFSGLKDSLLTSLETTNSIETTAYAAKQKFIESDDLKPQSILKSTKSHFTNVFIVPFNFRITKM